MYANRPSRIINIRKDGNEIENLRKVVVPKDIVEGFIDIAKQKTEVRRRTSCDGYKFKTKTK